MNDHRKTNSSTKISSLTAREEIIRKYVEAYNNFDIPKMTENFSNEILFENIENETTTLTLKGIEEFKSQAEKAKTYFSERQQKIKSFRHEDRHTEVEIEYFGVLAIDFPNGMQKGQKLFVNGRSEFVFKNKRIVKLTDIS